MNRVLVAAAHPDDEILGVGGAVARHIKAGDKVTVLIAADCMSARGDTGLIGEVRLPEAALTASAILGTYGPMFLGLPGMKLAATDEVEFNRHVDKVVRAVEPDIVYTHWWDDPNSDHRTVCRAIMIAMRPAGRAQRVLCFETPSSTEWNFASVFRPTYFVDITASIDKKLEAMACYGAELRELPHPRNLEALRERAAYWGQVAGCRYAEAFVLAREVCS